MRKSSIHAALRMLTLVWSGCALVWLPLEGDLGREVTLAASGLALAMAHWLARPGGRRITSLVPAAGWGAALGLGAGAALLPAVLLLMALKTGLHAHGAEYTAAELAWLWAQVPWWIGAGGLAGVGLTLLWVARHDGPDS